MSAEYGINAIRASCRTRRGTSWWPRPRSDRDPKDDPSHLMLERSRLVPHHRDDSTDLDVVGLAASITGPVLTTRDSSFAAECSPYNLAVRHAPAVVVGATDAADVQAAVRFAAGNGLPVAVLATGHQAITPADGGMLITTRGMTGVEVDPEARTVRFEAGVRWQQVVDATVKHNLAPLNGSSPLVGAVGYTLGGGLSPTMGRAFGWAADHVRSVDVVTADGQLRHVTAESESDLFWAVRGGKSNFGIVTAVECDLFPVDRLYAGGLFFDGEHAASVLHAYRALTEAAPEELTTSVALLRLPPLPFVPEPLRGRFTVHVRVSYLGSAAEGDRLIAPLRAAAPTLIDAVGELPYERFAEIHSDPVDPAPFVERSAMLSELTPRTVDTVLALAGAGTDCPAAFVELRHLGGALSRPPRVPNAVGNRDAAFALWIVAIGTPEDTAVPMAFADRALGELAPWSTGGKYLNFMSTHDASADLVKPAYDADTYTRLEAIKSSYDPTNLFRLNHNIPPRSSTAGISATQKDTIMTAPGIDMAKQVAALTDHAAIVDTLHRYAAALDHADADLLTSALTEDAVVDLTPATAKIGLEFPVLSPRDTVVAALIGAVGPLDTSHSITNVRAQVDGDRAEAHCYAQAQHFLPGQGPNPTVTTHALMMNRYRADLVRDGAAWRIRRLTIDSAWFDGDPAVLVSQA